MNCLLSEKMRQCEEHNCERCGWNPDESLRRVEYIKTHGLKRLENGLYALVLPDNWNDR